MFQITRYFVKYITGIFLGVKIIDHTTPTTLTPVDSHTDIENTILYMNERRSTIYSNRYYSTLSTLNHTLQYKPLSL